jgi:hypothetical protein
MFHLLKLNISIAFCIFVAMLKKTLSFLMIFAFSVTSFAHEYYFAYAELTYNELQKRFEGTIIFTTHDLERAIEPKGSLIGKFEKLDETSAELKVIENYINQHFQITYGCALDSNAADAICMSQFTLEGIVTQLNGTIECYISSSTGVFYNPVQFQFDALMERFPAQQNKLTFTYRNQKETLNFIPDKELQNIHLKP